MLTNYFCKQHANMARQKATKHNINKKALKVSNKMFNYFKYPDKNVIVSFFILLNFSSVFTFSTIRQNKENNFDCFYL